MSKSSRKLWKAYIHFPYDLMKLHTWEAAKFQYQFICTSTLSSPKLTLGTVSLCSFGDSGWSGSGTQCTRPYCRNLHRALLMSRCQLMSSMSFPLDHFHHTFACMNSAMFRTPVANGVCEFWNDTDVKGKTTCALMCKQQQLRSPTWTEKQKGKMKTVHWTAD